MSNYKIHLIGNAHIDPVWLWRWTEGKDEVIRTYRQAITFMKEFPDFIFNASQAVTYKWVEEEDPQLFADIQHYVKNGRWNIVNGWWVEPDCNVPSGESLARQGLYGKLYFKEKFAVDVKVGYNVDTFGHPAGLPQILKKSGFEYYLFLRPEQHEKNLKERIFWWQGPDGTKILTWRLLGSYNSGGWNVLHQKIEDMLPGKISDLNEDMCFFGVGDHGGGPTRDELLGIKDFKKEGYEFIQSTPDIFFNNVLLQKKNFITIKDDLQYHARGCYSVVSWIKKANRKSENLLIAAEKLSSVSEIAKINVYPAEEIRKNWHKVLFNQFHDILCGTSITEAYEDCKKDYDEVFSDAGKILNTALSGIFFRVNTDRFKGQAVIVFNVLGNNRQDVIELEAPDKNMKVVDNNGKDILFQENILDNEAKIIFKAELPAFGYSTFYLQPQTKKRKWKSALRISNSSLENELFFLQINPLTGNIIHLFDKKKKVNIIEHGKEANEMLVMEDLSDTWSHSIASFDKLIGKFLIQGKPEIVEEGPARITLRIRSTFLNSEIVQNISMYNNVARIDFDTKLIWREKFKMLKVGFAFAINSKTSMSEIPFGVMERNNTGEEEPGQTWVDISGTIKNTTKKIKYGISLLNDCKYSYSINGNEIRLSLVRSPMFAWHDPKVPEPGVEYDHTDQGEHNFRYSLIFHNGNWQKNRTPKFALEFNNPLIVKQEPAHRGVLNNKNSFIDIKEQSVNLIAFKKEENGKNYILRLFESCGKKINSTISISFLKFSFKASFKPYEIKTYRIVISEKKILAQECNLIEESL